MAEGWKTVRVFISSTFRDMQAERDHLVRFVFPRLREELLRRRIHLVDVDLRWGVTSDQDAFELCMDEIDRCKPRFLCMLGGRYGWVPPARAGSAGTGRSITASEIHYAALDKLDAPAFRYFYFRDPAVTRSIPDPHAMDYREADGSPAAEALEAIKRRISTVSGRTITGAGRDGRRPAAAARLSLCVGSRHGAHHEARAVRRARARGPGGQHRRGVRHRASARPRRVRGRERRDGCLRRGSCRTLRRGQPGAGLPRASGTRGLP